MNTITIDRSRAEQYADCPHKGFLILILDVLKAQSENKQVFGWELAIFSSASPELIETLRPYALSGRSSVICEAGTEIHAVIDAAFTECEGDLGRIPEWIVENLPRVRPDLQPEAIHAGRYVADVLADLHIPVIGTEVQIEYELFPATASRSAVVVTCALDLLGAGLHNSLHVHDWKTGYKARSDSETKNSFQAQFGALVLWKQPQYKDVERIHWWYQETRHGSKSYAAFERHYEHPRLPHLTQEVAFECRIEEAVKLILDNRQDCWPMPEKCCWCDVVRFCQLAHAEAKDIAADPKGFVNRAIVMESLLRKYKKAMAEWVKAKGAIVGDKYVFDRKTPTGKFMTDFVERDLDRDYTKPKHIELPSSTGDESIDAFF